MSEARSRTLDKVREDALARVGKRAPFEAALRGDVEEAYRAMKSLDGYHWSEQCSKIGARYEGHAAELERDGARAAEIHDAYFKAFNYYRIGRYPVPSSPGKMACYRSARLVYLKAARYFDPPLEVVEIPFEGSKIVGYLQIPPCAAPPPLVIHWGGVDGWKEDRLRNSRILHRAGLATFAMDIPGTGENPLRYGEPHALGIPCFRHDVS